MGDQRSHCCARTRGCGEVFDDVELFDAHRIVGCCVSPWVIGLVQTNGRAGCDGRLTCRTWVSARTS